MHLKFKAKEHTFALSDAIVSMVIVNELCKRTTILLHLLFKIAERVGFEPTERTTNTFGCL